MNLKYSELATYLQQFWLTELVPASSFFSHISAGGSPLVLVRASYPLPSSRRQVLCGHRALRRNELGLFLLSQYVPILHTGHFPLLPQCIRF